jgi:hypothetical protein
LFSPQIQKVEDIPHDPVMVCPFHDPFMDFSRMPEDRKGNPVATVDSRAKDGAHLVSVEQHPIGGQMDREIVRFEAAYHLNDPRVKEGFAVKKETYPFDSDL